MNPLVQPDPGLYIWTIITFVVLGGTGTVAGPVVGATLLTLLSEVLRQTGPWELVLHAVSLILVILLLPNGLVGLGRARWLARTKPAPTEAPREAA